MLHLERQRHNHLDHLKIHFNPYQKKESSNDFIGQFEEWNYKLDVRWDATLVEPTAKLYI